MIDQPPHSLGNIWFSWPGAGCEAQYHLSPTALGKRPYDVAILGAGVIGCALAYELSQYNLRIVMVDRAFDFGEGTSKANSAIIHTGFDAEPESLESRLVGAASRQWPLLAEQLKIPFRAVSALMLAFDDEQLAQLPALREKALANGVDDVRLVSASEARRLEPRISPAVVGGLLVPRESIVDPFTTSIAYAEAARANGVDVVFGMAVEAVEPAADGHAVVAAGGCRLVSRYVINACGLGSGRLIASYGGERVDLNPRRGQFVVYDRSSARLVSRILLPIPTKQTKGMLVAPTIFGNLLAGPTAEDLPSDQTDATGVTAEGLAAVAESARRMCPALASEPVIAHYAGLRCNCAQGSYWIRTNDGAAGIVTLAGIRSTGLTASHSTAQYVVRRMAEECGLQLERRPNAVGERPASKWPGWWRRPFEDPRRLAERPAYGRIVCSCENISSGEIEDALAECPGAATLDGLKRRTRALMGRCQGFNCGVSVARMISRHYGIPLPSVTRHGPGSEFIAEGRCENAARRPSETAPAPLLPHYRAIVIGAGPAGVGAAVGLARRGVAPVLVVDRADQVGGVPARYEAKAGGVPTFIVWSRGRVMFGQDYAAKLAQQLERAGAQVCLEAQVADADPDAGTIKIVSTRGCWTIRADAVVFACGARELTRSERGWIVGARPARQFYTLQLLELLDECHALPMRRPAIVGSDLIAYSAAAKLRASGTSEAAIFDRTAGPLATWLQRRYFRRWTTPAWCAVDGSLTVSKSGEGELMLDDSGQRFDGVVYSGELTPNNELLVAAGVEPATRSAAVSRRWRQLSAPQWFVSGGAVGGLHGAEWCYWDGRRAAAAVAGYIKNLGSRGA